MTEHDNREGVTPNHRLQRSAPFRLLRNFSLASLLLIALSIAGLSYVYRHMAMVDLTTSGETHNHGLTKVIANAIWPEFGPFLRSASQHDDGTLQAHPRIKQLDEAIRRQVQGTSVIKIKIYAMNGRTLYSSEAKQIGEDKSRNTGFIAARDGGLASEITHRSKFSAFDQIIEDRGVLSSYVPMRNATGQVEGVFEVYDDVTALVALLDRTQVKVTLGAAAVLMALYGALLVIVMRADRILRVQHAAQQLHQSELESRIAERTFELAQATDAAQAANRAKSQFLANMGHELRTPMSAVIGFAELLLASELTDTQRGRVANICGAGRGLLRIINDILDVSRIEAGRMDLISSRFDPRSMLEQVREVLEPLAGAKGIAIALEQGNAIPAAVFGDEARLRQILVNLGTNAVKFTERGEVRLALEARKTAPGWVQLRFALSDTGIGMGEEQIGRLFAPFVQLDAGSNRRYGGIGLGLHIAREFTMLMGGSLEVQSRPGGGTCFELQLSMRVAPAVAAAPEIESAPAFHVDTRAASGKNGREVK